MEEYLIIIVRTIFLYVTIITIFRLMGKREIGELSILDLVVFIMIAEMAVVAIEDTSKPMLQTLVPMFILLFIQISLAIISLKHKSFRDFIEGKPSILIKHGKVDENELKKQRYNFDDLLIQLREKKIRNVSDVEFGILEPSGKLSVIEKNQNEAEDTTLPFPVIMDGEVQEDVLNKINKTNLWLRQELRKLGYKDVKNISLCTIDKAGNLHVDLKDEH